MMIQFLFINIWIGGISINSEFSSQLPSKMHTTEVKNESKEAANDGPSVLG